MPNPALFVAPIVEGHGEVPAIRILLTRLGFELFDGAYIEVLQPIRWPKTQLVQPAVLRQVSELAGLKLKMAGAGDRGLILVLFDADEDLPCQLAPQLLNDLTEHCPHLEIACVLAQREYETWFVAAAASLSGHLTPLPGETWPEAPEAQGCGKAWITRRFAGSYSETLDQPKLTSKMDLVLCRQRSPSFDKLCRELERRIKP